MRAPEALTRAWASIRARRTLWMALGALAFGAVAVVGARNYIAARLAIETARLQPRHEPIEIVVAKRDLRRGDVVGSDTMAVRSIPREYAPGGAIVPARFDAVAGARLLMPMKAGEPLLPTAIASADSGPISTKVRPGIRAMTVAVDEVNSLSGMLQPGDRIDLLLSVRPPAIGGLVQPEVTRTVLQDVPVMATGRQSRAGTGEDAPVGRSFTSITVEVLPDQAQKLVVAQRSGKLTAVLRNPNDRQPVSDRRLDVNMLLGLAPPPAPSPAPAPPPRPTLEVIVGGRGQATPVVVPQGLAPAVPPPATALPAAGPSAPAPSPDAGSTPALPPAWLAPPATVPLFR